MPEKSDFNILKTMSPEDMGKKLQGFGINILVPKPLPYIDGLVTVLGLTLIRSEEAFVLLSWADESTCSFNTVIQVHADFTYASNPYYAYLTDQDMRGRGVEFRLFNYDPDAITARAEAQHDWTVLQPATDKPHGLREAFILDDLGYCWVPSLPLD